MSASSKKKLRSELNNQKLTERQLEEQKEAKKLKLYTGIFVTVLVLLVVTALTIGIYRGVIKSGVLEKNTTAVTIGEHKISNAELNYFYVDTVINYYSQVGSFASLLGLDITLPLDEQILDEATGTTWADNFIDGAISDAKNVYAIVDAANAASYELDEASITNLDNSLLNAEFSALMGGYPSFDSYLKSMYGTAADKDSYREYLMLRQLANDYYAEYTNSLTYEDAQLREAEKENFHKFSSFTYNYHYVSVNDFLEGGTTDEAGKVTYSDEEKAAAQKAAEAAAQALIGEMCISVEAFDDLIAAMPGAKADAASVAVTNTLYTKVSPTVVQEWVASADRKADDKAVLTSSSTSTVDGKEVETINGYYAVYYVSVNDNNYPLANVRHILIQPEGGVYNSETGYNDYTEEALAAAKLEAEELLKQWQDGEKTEESFAALANEHSADGDGTTGGLYEEVAPGMMVTAFNDWCFTGGRKAGDTGIVESEYGYHIMYYVGNHETLYRDYMIEGELRATDVSKWNTDLVAALTVVDGNTKFLYTDLVLANYTAG